MSNKMMSSKIEQLIDEIEAYIDECKPTLFNSNNIVVNKEVMDEYLRDLRMTTPEEIKRCQKIISNQEAIMADAREKATGLINEATAKTTELVNQETVTQQAYDQAEEIVALASKQAQEIVDAAAGEANQMRAAAVQYTDSLLENVEKILKDSLDLNTAKYESLVTSLTDCFNIVTANRAELYPTEPIDQSVFDDEPAQKEE